jgi:hypothetical protein
MNAGKDEEHAMLDCPDHESARMLLMAKLLGTKAFWKLLRLKRMQALLFPSGKEEVVAAIGCFMNDVLKRVRRRYVSFAIGVKDCPEGAVTVETGKLKDMGMGMGQ